MDVLVWVLLAAAVAVVVYALRRVGRRRAVRVRGFRAVAPDRLPPGVPRPREVHWAAVPFEDGSGVKDRPCLVLAANAERVVVAKITTREYPPARPVRLPAGTVDDRRGRVSWVEPANVRVLSVGAFRRRAGAVDGAVWDQVRRRAR
ncbi:type II toxin-antitoxin system PemK/MazF family toxin [Streptomyces sp. NPDC049881]|uniref:type II toxin-antitoxin system PemK/MazF family toxin n=1 Tax=Streptomyces sp. NPDC049881 TaxID=3155778 RepID=UPI003427C706